MLLSAFHQTCRDHYCWQLHPFPGLHLYWVFEEHLQGRNHWPVSGLIQGSEQYWHRFLQLFPFPFRLTMSYAQPSGLGSINWVGPVFPGGVDRYFLPLHQFQILFHVCACEPGCPARCYTWLFFPVVCWKRCRVHEVLKRWKLTGILLPHR